MIQDGDVVEHVGNAARYTDPVVWEANVEISGAQLRQRVEQLAGESVRGRGIDVWMNG
jgi:hypothetical protein